MVVVQGISSSETNESPLLGGYDEEAPSNYSSLLQNIISLIGLFCKRDMILRGLLIEATP